MEEERRLGGKKAVRLVEKIKAGEKLGKEPVGLSIKSEVHRRRETYKYLGEGHSLKTEKHSEA